MDTNRQTDADPDPLYAPWQELLAFSAATLTIVAASVLMLMGYDSAERVYYAAMSTVVILGTLWFVRFEIRIRRRQARRRP